MKRCSRFFTTAGLSRVLSIGLLAISFSTSALAQGVVRTFPDTALRGTMEISQPPWITMDGKTAQLSPGARIHGTNNLLMLSAGMVNQKFLVNYELAPGGLVHRVWVLTEAEAALKRPRAADLKN